MYWEPACISGVWYQLWYCGITVTGGVGFTGNDCGSVLLGTDWAILGSLVLTRTYDDIVTDWDFLLELISEHSFENWHPIYLSIPSELLSTD